MRRRIKEFEARYGMDSDTFRGRFEAGELGDGKEFFLWWSLLEALRAVEEKLKSVEEELHKLL